MKLLEYVYLRLKETDEVENAEQLSIKWCNKNRNWFAWQRHADQDFSIDAAINCLAETRRRLGEACDVDRQNCLRELELLLSAYLRHKHRIAEIA